MGDAKIEHVVVGATRNLSISSQGQLSLTAPSSVSLTSSSGPASVAVINSAVVLSGGTQSYITTGNSTAASPAYTLTNTNATAGSCPIVSTLVQGHNQVGTATDYLYRQQHIGKNISGTQIIFGGIDCISRNVGVGNEDGVLAFNCAINGISTKLLEINGNESEINAFQALDMNGQAIKSSSGNLTISTTSSTGTGNINVTPKVGASCVFSTQLTLPTTLVGATFASNTLACNFNNLSTGIFNIILSIGNVNTLDFSGGLVGGQYVIYVTASGGTRLINPSVGGTIGYKINFTSAVTVLTTSVALLTVTFDGTTYLIACSAYN